MKKTILDNIKTLFYALVIALIIRIFLFQPFYIPSSSMEPNLLIGDRLFVSKFSYGYSRHSFPFSPNVFDGRVLRNKPKQGDVIVFKTPADNRTDYIKRLIGMPGDSVKIENQELYLNNKKIIRKKVNDSFEVYCGNEVISTNLFEEMLPNGVKYLAAYRKDGTMDNTDEYNVPENHYFFMGDNRDCSKDSRFLSSVGYVHLNNLVGKAQIIFFSTDRTKGNIFNIWKWNDIIRFKRLLKKIQ